MTVSEDFNPIVNGRNIQALVQRCNDIDQQLADLRSALDAMRGLVMTQQNQLQVMAQNYGQAMGALLNGASTTE